MAGIMLTKALAGVLQTVNARQYARLPACVTAKQRAILHALAEQHGIQHSSVGDGEARQLLLGDPQQPLQVCVAVTESAPI